LIFIISCPSLPIKIQPQHPDNDETITVPEWFIETPHINGINLVYAYSSKYLNKKTEKKKLLISAAKQIAKTRKVNLTIVQKGKLQTGKYLRHTEISESEALINENNLEEKYTIIHKYPIGSGILALAAETAHIKNIDISRINEMLRKVNVNSPPQWVSSPPTQQGFIFGVGCAQNHSSPEKAWKAAEKNARAAIALQLNSSVIYKNKGIQKSMWEWIVTNHQICSSMMLTDVSIIKHGFCKTNRTYYALARMPHPPQ